MSAVRATELVTPVAVEVTFLRMDRRPPELESPALPPDSCLERLARPTVPFYRYLYDTVGGDYLWWFRRTVPDAHLASVLAAPRVSVHVLYRDGGPAGFFELERRPNGTTNLSYFGLLPHAVGQGIGAAFLREAIDLCWSEGCAAVTVNTCTADHPRALPNYLAAGFVPFRRVREEWPVPARLGMRPPPWLAG